VAPIVVMGFYRETIMKTTHQGDNLIWPGFGLSWVWQKIGGMDGWIGSYGTDWDEWGR